MATLARKIALACYPEYKGRKIRVESAEAYNLRDFWEGGTRNFAVAYNLITGETRQPTEDAQSPFSYIGQDSKRIPIPGGFAIVEHAIYCGKDIGITIYVNPAVNKAGLIAEVA
jgi:hypothetical protein